LADFVCKEIEFWQGRVVIGLYLYALFELILIEGENGVDGLWEIGEDGGGAIAAGMDITFEGEDDLTGALRGKEDVFKLQAKLTQEVDEVYGFWDVEEGQDGVYVVFLVEAGFYEAASGTFGIG
jgi:hypothetical protein